MSYTDLTKVKTFLWVTGEAQDAKLQIMIDWTTWVISSLLWCDYWESTKTEIISYCDVLYWNTIFFHNVNIQSISKINGLVYNWVAWTDYKILPPNNRKVQILDLRDYTNNSKFSYFTIEYVSWYDLTTPTGAEVQIDNDLTYLQNLLVEWELNWWDIKTEKLWPRSVTFKDKNSLDMAMAIIWKYRIVNII